MTTDLFSMPTLPQKAPSSLKSDPIGSLVSDPNLKADRSGLPKNARHENFMATLKKAFRDQNPSDGSTTVAAESKKTDGNPDDLPANDLGSPGDDALKDVVSQQLGDEAAITDQMQLAAELKELLALLEEVGLKNPLGEWMRQPGTKWAVENMSHPVEQAQDGLTALKQLIGAIQPNDLKSGNDITSGLKQLRHFLIQALAANTTAHNQNTAQDGPNQIQPQGSVDVIDVAKGIAQGLENVTGFNDTLLEGKLAGGEKPVEIGSAGTRSAMAAENVHRETGSIKGGENPAILIPTGQSEKPDPARPNPDMRAATEADVAAKTSKAPEMASGNGPIKAPEMASGNGPIKENVSEMAEKTALSGRNADYFRSLSPSESGHRSGGEPMMENASTVDSTPVSKIINDAQIGKDNPLQIDTGSGEDAGSKVVKVEAGTSDSGQLASQGQTSEKAAETTALPKEAEAAQRELRTQTLEQIVRRAVIQVRDGQHEARIDLKPEFLGHVRMQVITENQQVTVKILTEFGFVKDMIENNIQQLKADLQQQGLDVDKLDVSVSRDSNGHKHQQENTQHAGKRTRDDQTGDRENTGEDQHGHTDRSSRKGDGRSTVDYFA